jgi:hypothetical protein
MTRSATRKVSQGVFSSFAIPKQYPLGGHVGLHALGFLDRANTNANHKTRPSFAAIAALILSMAPLATATTFLALPVQAHETATHADVSLTPEHIAELHSGEILTTEDDRQFVLVAPLSELWEIDAAGKIIAEHRYAFDGGDFLLFFEDGHELRLAGSDPAPLGAMLAGTRHDLAHFYSTLSGRSVLPGAPEGLEQAMLFATGPGFAEIPNEYTRHWEADGEFVRVQLLDGSIRRFHWTELDKHLTSITDRLAHD